MERAEQAMRSTLKRKALEAGSLSQLLQSLSHKSVLDRGFALVRGEDGHVVCQAETAKTATRLDIEFADGHVSVKSGGASDDRGVLSRKGFASPRRIAPAKDDGSQGSLL